MTDQNKHIEKLKKLLALAASGNPHEAALALRRARKLMDVHGITHSDIAMMILMKPSATTGRQAASVRRATCWA